jgi:gas vesicle protein
VVQRSKQITYGLGGLGVLLGSAGVLLLASQRGREILRRVALHLDQAPNVLEQFASATQEELDNIQETLDQIAARLQTVG